MGLIDKLLVRWLASAGAEPRPAGVASPAAEEVIIEARRMAPALSDILAEVAARVTPGLTTVAINDQVDRALGEAGLEPAMKDYNGFPMSATVSVNEQILHAIPSTRRVSDGDLIKIQTAGRGREGFVAQGWTFGVGTVPAQTTRLLATASEALCAAATVIRAGARTGDVGAAIQETVEGAGFAVIRQFVGSGIGRALHEPPALPCYGVRGRGLRLNRGQVLHVQVIMKRGYRRYSSPTTAGRLWRQTANSAPSRAA